MRLRRSRPAHRADESAGMARRTGRLGERGADHLGRAFRDAKDTAASPFRGLGRFATTARDRAEIVDVVRFRLTIHDDLL